MMIAPANAARILCWETDVRLIDPFWTPHHRLAPPTIRPSKAGVDGPLLDATEKRRHLGRARQ